MNTSYTAMYYDATGRFYQATIFVSSVTISIRYINEEQQQRNVYWLAKDIISFNELGTATQLQYHNKQGGTERLVIRDELLVQAIKNNLGHHRLIGKIHKRLLGSVWTRLLFIAGSLVTVLLVIYLWLLPKLSDHMATRFSKEDEINMGEQMYQAVMTQYKPQIRKTVLLNEFYKQLQYKVDYPVHITVVESGEMNAFAIPGGHIVVYDAILERMKTPEELAALLAHESSHVALRHSLRSMFRGLARKMFLSLLFGNTSGIVSVAVDNADDLEGLQYSRLLETEADDNGMRLMAQSNINVEGMLQLMHMLQQETNGDEPAAFLSTHPVFPDRIRHIEQQVQLLGTAPAGSRELKRIFHAIYE